MDIGPMFKMHPLKMQTKRKWASVILIDEDKGYETDDIENENLKPRGLTL